MRKLLFGLLILAATLGLVGCDGVGFIPASGPVVTRELEFSDFNRIEAGSAFEVEIVPASTYRVEITAHESLFDRLDVSKSGRTLRVFLKPGSYTNARPQARISLPDIEWLKLSGATRGNMRGFHLEHNFDLEISGASTLETDIEMQDFNINISGASRLNGNLKAGVTRMEISGASNLELDGSGSRLTLEASGASRAVLEDFPIGDADVTLSGASRATIEAGGRLDAEISGASTLEYGGNPALGRVNVTGASTLRRR